MFLGDSESEASWSELLSRLKARDLKGVELVVSDEHKELVKAIERYFIRNVLDASPKSLQKELHGRLGLILEASDMETASWLLRETMEAYAHQAPKALEKLEASFEEAMAVMALPERYRKRLRTINGMERLNEEIYRWQRVIRIFPNEELAVRLIGAVLVEIDEAWTTGKCYFHMAEYWKWKAKTEKHCEEMKTAHNQVNAA